jgi:hypothetical protein
LSRSSIVERERERERENTLGLVVVLELEVALATVYDLDLRRWRGLPQMARLDREEEEDEEHPATSTQRGDQILTNLRVVVTDEPWFTCHLTLK